MVSHGERCGCDECRRARATHGLASTYRGEIRCRCDECTRAHSDRCHAEFISRRKRLKANPQLAPHGTVNTAKQWGCPCEACRAALRGR